jgi:hypothetical protein
MKEIYSFPVSKDVVEQVAYKRKTKKGEVESTRKVKKKKVNRIVFEKPSVADIEMAEFFFGQKYNEYINAGFLTRAMLYAKIGGKDYDGLTDNVRDAILENLEAAKVIEFYEGSKSLSEDQQKKLDGAKERFVETGHTVSLYESSVQSQFSQTAEVKAEEKMVEWFIFNFSYYEDDVEDKKELFHLFSGSNFEEKRQFYLQLCEDKEDITNEQALEIKDIFDASFMTLARVVNIWYNKLGKNQKEIDEKIEELFPETL